MNMKTIFGVSVFLSWSLLTALFIVGFAGMDTDNKVTGASIKDDSNILSAFGEISNNPVLDASEVSKHDSSGSCWLIINGKVYDVTSYLPLHPGRSAVMIPFCGKDATLPFTSLPHSQYASSLLASYYVGDMGSTINNDTSPQHPPPNNVQSSQSNPPQNDTREQAIPPLSNPPNASGKNSSTQPSRSVSVYSSEQIILHNSTSSCWLIINNSVYDVTSYLPLHPAGPGSIAKDCGKDVTAAFARVSSHIPFAYSLLPPFYIGDIAADQPITAKDSVSPSTTATALNSAAKAYTFNTWTNSSYVRIALSCTDSGAPASGCNTTVYCKDTADTCTPAVAYSSPVQVSIQGISYIRFKSSDNSGNTEAVKSRTIRIDTIPPTITIYPANTTAT